jgi:pyruvate dehydrogenase E2 component (dihydrolipoamide acetyltransferase)
MAKILRMPEVAANATHAVLQSWTKREGDSVAPGDCIAEIETDKAIVEVSVDIDGVLARVLAKDGQQIAVGAPIAVVLEKGELTDIDVLLDTDALLPRAETASGADKAHLIEVNAGPAAGYSPSNVEASEIDLKTTLQAQTRAAEGGDRRVFASPLAKRLAKDRGIDILSLKGTGPNGRIVKNDVERFRAPTAVEPKEIMGAIPSPRGLTASGAFEEVPHTAMRRAIARRLSESKATVPHFYLVADCRVDKLIALRSQINNGATNKVSINDLVVKAVAVALKQVPEMNVMWTDSALRRFESVDIAVAVSTDNGLFTPVVRAADTKALSIISRDISEMASRARAGRLRQDELEGGCFSVSNLGMFGTQEFAAIINPPQSAILAVGAAIAQPVINEGQVESAMVMRCTLSVDHRAIDGALAARWSKAFTQLIENPLSMLI